MSWFFEFIRSTVGAKVLMALTGAGLVLYVLVHLAGNLQVYLGREVFNDYAYTLKSMPLLLWGTRAALLVGFVVHIGAAVRLRRLNRAARPERYAGRRHYQEASLPGLSMFWSGLFLLAFVTYHLAHFTLGLTHPEFLELRDPLGHHDAYSMFVKGFQDPLVSASYIVSMLLLALHLSHGVTSMFQSVGLNGRKSWPIIAKIGPAIAIIVAVGNISMPLAVMGALVRLPPGVN